MALLEAMDVAETTVETGLEYTEGEHVRVRVRQHQTSLALYDALLELE